jgi:hypothetical protein
MHADAPGQMLCRLFLADAVLIAGGARVGSEFAMRA